jgi:hypothetical protein
VQCCRGRNRGFANQTCAGSSLCPGGLLDPGPINPPPLTRTNLLTPDLGAAEFDRPCIARLWANAHQNRHWVATYGRVGLRRGIGFETASKRKGGGSPGQPDASTPIPIVAAAFFGFPFCTPGSVCVCAPPLKRRVLAHPQPKQPRTMGPVVCALCVPRGQVDLPCGVSRDQLPSSTPLAHVWTDRRF